MTTVTAEPELIPRQALADAVRVAAFQHFDPGRADAAAKRAIKSYSVQPQRGSDWFGDNCAAGLTPNQGRRMLFEFTAHCTDRCSSYGTPGHREPCALCTSGDREVAALRERVLEALETGAQVPRADGTVPAPVLPPRARPAPSEPPARLCENETCNKPIGEKPPTARYCSASCRVTACRRRNRGK